MRRLHRIATFVVGVPLVVWTATGFAFTWFDFAAVRGAADRVEPAPFAAADVHVPLGDAIARAGGSARAVELRAVAGRPTWIVDGKRIDAVDGTIGAALDRDAAMAIARAAHRGQPGVIDATLMTEARQASDMDLPVWRVRLDDGHGTEVFVSPSTGAIVAWRNKAWRRFDAIWSLHVFGFVSRDNPAHLPLRIAGGLAL
ncbi:MAG TPA: PepSY domain-containing protein, partial [Polyangia bacterium]